MALVNISNSTFDAALAAVPAPFGPFTRSGTTTDLDALPRVEPNSETPYEVVGQGSVRLWISYEELTNPGVLQNRLRKAYGLKFRMYEAQRVSEIIYRYLANITPLTMTNEQYQDAIHLFQYIVPIVGHLNPLFNYSELSRANQVDATFTVSGTGASRSVVNNSTGLIDKYLWAWGDNTFSYVEDPSAHVYAADGTYTIRLIAVGRGGVDQHSVSVTVDVP